MSARLAELDVQNTAYNRDQKITKFAYIFLFLVNSVTAFLLGCWIKSISSGKSVIVCRYLQLALFSWDGSTGSSMPLDGNNTSKN